MKIRSLVLDNITVLAPLAGITSLPFRLLAKECGCALVCSEMISSNGLVYKSKKTEQLLGSLPEEKPFSVQIFGSDPAMMAEAAQIVESSGADILDINFGCSVKKIVKSGSCVALMRTPEQAEAILLAVRKAIKIPMTLKIRSGWNASGEQAFRIAEIAEACGADAVTVHPRTATQGFSGNADWSLIAAIKKRISIPVIGNGDIAEPEDAIRMLTETGCDAVMIGRAAVGNPWIFSRILTLLRGEQDRLPDTASRKNAMLRYLNASVNYFGEERACRKMRSQLGWFVKGMPYSSNFRESIKRISTEAAAIEIINDYINEIEVRGEG
ncbi:MAG: tRNA dihydrouridine synthase DusB [Desulfobacteraceae bacterium IS3]|nr:MAG: tRNA dihydrouridine synthase DusB [Desulfobacteraceae bacterium IS3]